MSIAQQIESIVSSMTDNNIPPKLVTIIKGYDKAICDIQTDNGILKNIQCSTLAAAGDNGLLVYNNGEENKPFVIVFKESKNSDLIDLIYPVGSIYMSVNNTSPSILFGGEWEQIEDKFLLASGTTYSNGDSGGSADAVVVSHNHTQKAHNHTQNAHNHNANSNSFVQSNVDLAINGTKRAFPSTGSSAHFVYIATDEYKSSSTINISSTTANRTATNQSQTAENNPTGVDGTGKNMPPYLTVNVWQRIA